MTTIRAASASDIPALVALMEEFYAESSFPLDREWAAASFAALLADPSLGGAWLAEVEGAHAGYAVLTVRFSMEYGGRDGHIDDLYVRPDYRRRSVARELLAALFEEGRRRGLLAVHVEVGENNTAARSLYMGFGLHARHERTVILTARPDFGRE